ncbi:hypothetical protein E4M02_11030 [Brevundimonas sp. S30B]|uniref:hypothetical protein n=1 Tax=unclassified Brevundimonas TaxID=2622653 RepID=UPI001072B8A5|nr:MULTISPECIES: hypothetical protein [unclassified Brevundimonas]QBX38647.1 hypothetical protein E4M01_13290 [Brevundimonas sp. MF30-B]TFW01238.1 hypothetical protein E4M02_11030 [Brevundimonas sp. S30B]
MQEVRFGHGFYYPDNHDIPLSDIAATLLAHERLLPIVADALENIVPGLSVDDRKIFLERIERSSLKEYFYVALFVAFQDDLEQEVPAVIEAITGMPVSDRYDTIITVLFIVAVYHGANAIFRRGKNSTDSAVPANIVEDQRAYTELAAEKLSSTPEKVARAFDKAIGKQKLALVQRAAVDLFRPAKRGLNGRIIPRGLDPIRAETVAAFPDAIAMAELDDDVVPVHLPRARLHIRATDRDKTDKGWAGRVENDDLKTKRLPIRLAPGIDPDKLAELHEPEVEAILESRFKDDGTTKPVRIHVFRVL